MPIQNTGLLSGGDGLDIGSLTEVTAVAGDKAIIVDATDGALKKFDISDVLSGGVSALADLDTVVTGTQLDDIKTKIDNIEANATADQTPAEIKTALETLTATNRLDASAIKNLPSAPSITVLNNDVTVVNNDSTFVTGLPAVLTRATTAGLVYYEADLMFEESYYNVLFGLFVSETEPAINMAANGFVSVIREGTGYSTTETFSSTQSSGQLFSENAIIGTRYHYIIKGIFNMTGGASVDININFKQKSARIDPAILKKGSSAKMWAL